MPTHPKIKGLAGVGGLPASDVLVGFDKDAFESYGLAKSANTPMSAQTATIYAAALNELITNHGLRLGNAMVVYWYRDSLPNEDDVLSWIETPPADQQALIAERLASDMLAGIRNGQRPDLADNRYYALTLSGAAGRVMVRGWQEGAFVDLVRHIAAWFDDLDIVGHDGTPARAPKFLAIAGTLVRDLKDLPPPLIESLWRAALGADPIPGTALTLAVHRARLDILTDKPLRSERIGLIKAYHRRKGDKHVSASLNPEHPSPAYHCGRLLAVLANLHRPARLPQRKKT